MKALWQHLPARALAVLMAASLVLGGCSHAEEGSSVMGFKPQRSRLTEVSPPFTIQALKQALEANQPQVAILSPKPGQIVEKTQVEVQLQVKDLDLYKDADLDLGPYLQVLLDSQPYAQIYDVSQPLTLENLTPGTHTIRAFAVRPWHESFKNDGALAQMTFHVFAKTPENNPDASLPLLTYNYPQGIYGAEPVLLDFLLTNAPLHLVARENDKDDIPDWQLRCTVNGESFTFDRWEPIYLKGLKPGTNWVQLELLDEKGKPLPNAFNNAVQLVTYEPGGSDTLALLTRGELTAEAARKIVDPNYLPPVIAPEPEVTEPEVTEPEVTEPEMTEPKLAEPDNAEPPVEPERLQPELTEPEPAEPKLAEPELGKPELSKPEASEPEMIAPKIAEPKTAEPDSAEPDSAEPKIAEPEAIIEPDLTEELAPEDIPPELIAPTHAPKQPSAIESPLPPEERLEPEVTFTIPPELSRPALPNPDVIDSAALMDLTPETAKRTKPDLIGALDRVKGFFEDLRKRPTEATPLFSPVPDSPSNGSTAVPPGEATIVDTLMDSLPDSLRKPLMEELSDENATASPPSPN